MAALSLSWGSAPVALVVLIAIAVRYAVSLHPHSGEGDAPLFGDFEAQRHWMELTTALPTLVTAVPWEPMECHWVLIIKACEWVVIIQACKWVLTIQACKWVLTIQVWAVILA